MNILLITFADTDLSAFQEAADRFPNMTLYYADSVDDALHMGRWDMAFIDTCDSDVINRLRTRQPNAALVVVTPTERLPTALSVAHDCIDADSLNVETVAHAMRCAHARREAEYRTKCATLLDAIQRKFASIDLTLDHCSKV